ncbi:hypothetical protein [Hansschlegelia plantiphila]|nr:hypothetical protein [Hansschlegelia plantiphila]
MFKRGAQRPAWVVRSSRTTTSYGSKRKALAAIVDLATPHRLVV